MRCDQARSALYNLTLPISKVTRLPTQVGEQETQPITWPSSANNASLLQGHIKLTLELKQSLYLYLYILFLPSLLNASQVARHVWPNKLCNMIWHYSAFQELWDYHFKRVWANAPLSNFSEQVKTLKLRTIKVETWEDWLQRHWPGALAVFQETQRFCSWWWFSSAWSLTRLETTGIWLKRNKWCGR